MKKVFLDCGTNLGQGLIKFIDDKVLDNTFEIHCFEPNPYAIEFSKQRLSDARYAEYSIIFNEVALWTEDCNKVFESKARNYL